MSVFTVAIGIAITSWVSAMGGSALLATQGAQKWFGEMLKQNDRLMRINGLGLLISAGLLGLNLLAPATVPVLYVKFALFGIMTAQLSTLFMQKRGGAPRAAMIGPAVLLALSVVYWFIRT